MNLRKTLLTIEIASFAIAFISLYIVLFVLGNTQYIEETARPAVTVALAMFGGAGALTGAIIHGVGVPPGDKPPAKSRKRKSR